VEEREAFKLEEEGEKCSSEDLAEQGFIVARVARGKGFADRWGPWHCGDGDVFGAVSAVTDAGKHEVKVDVGMEGVGEVRISVMLPAGLTPMRGLGDVA
jgi:hypothetical protein